MAIPNQNSSQIPIATKLEEWYEDDIDRGILYFTKVRQQNFIEYLECDAQ